MVRERNFFGVNGRGATWGKWSSAKLPGMNGPGAKLPGMNGTGAKLPGMNGPGAKFFGGKWSRSDLGQMV